MITNSYLHIIGAVLCILLIWLLLLGALCCRCGAYETKIRFTLLWYVYIYIYNWIQYLFIFNIKLQMLLKKKYKFCLEYFLKHIYIIL